MRPVERLSPYTLSPSVAAMTRLPIARGWPYTAPSRCRVHAMLSFPAAGFAGAAPVLAALRWYVGQSCAVRRDGAWRRGPAGGGVAGWRDVVVGLADPVAPGPAVPAQPVAAMQTARRKAAGMRIGPVCPGRRSARSRCAARAGITGSPAPRPGVTKSAMLFIHAGQ